MTNRNRALLTLWDEQPRSQRELFAEERNRLTELLFPMVDEFGVTRKRLRRWVRSCEGSAFHNLRSGESVSGIFIPEAQATLLDLFIDFKTFPI